VRFTACILEVCVPVIVNACVCVSLLVQQYNNSIFASYELNQTASVCKHVYDWAPRNDVRTLDSRGFMLLSGNEHSPARLSICSHKILRSIKSCVFCQSISSCVNSRSDKTLGANTFGVKTLLSVQTPNYQSAIHTVPFSMMSATELVPSTQSHSPWCLQQS